MKKLPLFIILLIALSSFVFYSCSTTNKATDSKMLHFNLEKGKGYDYEMVWDMETKVDGQLTVITVDGKYSMKIIEDDGETKSIETAYQSFKMNMDMMGMNISMDSDKPLSPGDNQDLEKNPLGVLNKVIRGLIGKPFIVKINKEGDIVEVTGFEKIISDLVDSTGIKQEAKKQVMASVTDQFNEGTLKDNFAQIFTMFPNKEVKVGDTWEKTYKTGGKTASQMVTKYTVKAIDGDHVTLDANTDISEASTGSPLTGKQTGTIIVDSKTGLIVNATYDQTMEIKEEGSNIVIVAKGKIKGTAH